MIKNFRIYAVTILILISSLISGQIVHALDKPLTGADLLQTAQLNFTSNDRDKTFDVTIANLHTLFSRYKPATDSSSTLTKPLVVSGPEDRPVMRTSIKKCVFIICKTIDIVANVTAQRRQGSCARDFTISADLRQSTDDLANLYDRLDVFVCLQPVGANGTQMKMIVSAHDAPGYEEGMIQKTAFDLLKLQSPPMLEAIRKTLIANGAVMK